MAYRIIVQDGDPILKKVCRPVVKFDARLHALLDDMADTMLEANGVGLAGPQVGILRRVFVALDTTDEPGEEATEEEIENWEPHIIEFINPEILEEDGEIEAYEGCLSFPGQYGAITRPQKVKVRAFDRDGNPFTMEVEDMMARCVCHETNHLDGVVITDLADHFLDPNAEPEEETEENPIEKSGEK